MSNDILNAVQEYMINGHVSDAPFIINDYVITLERLDNGVRISATRGGQTESVVVYDGDLTNLDHEVLANRNADDQHPINAISGLRSELNSKQPVISDLEQIRTNAGKGATAVQHNELSDVATSGSYNDLNGKPNLARVATSGSYNDLSDKPSMVLDHNNLMGRSGYNQHPMSSITGLIDNLNSKQGVISDLNEIRANARKADTAVQPSDLARVATTGSYNDLTDKPTVFGNEVEVGPTPEDADLWIDTSESGSNVDPSVRWDVRQSLADAQNERARNNIGAVSDVQVNGTSVVSDGVANVPIASQTTYGAALYANNPASINARASGRVIRCRDIPYAVKSAMTAPVSTTDPAWTASEQAAARERMGAADVNDVNEIKDEMTYLIGDGEMVEIVNMLGDNGQFSTGWQNTWGGTHTISSGVLTLTTTIQYGGVRTTKEYTVNSEHVYYLCADIKTTSNRAYLSTNAAKNIGVYAQGIGDWEQVHFYGSPASSGPVPVSINDNSTTVGIPVQARNVLFIDLTECYGAGKEPTENAITKIVTDNAWFTKLTVKIGEEGQIDVIGKDISRLKSLTPDLRDKAVLIFGDSITATNQIGTNGTLTPYKTNWPTYAMERLNAKDWYNYGCDGSAYHDFAGSADNQTFYKQLQTAKSRGIDPDVVIVSLGTNDFQYPNTDSYEVAMNVQSIDSLDRTNGWQSLRYAMWALSNEYPFAQVFIATPIQRPDVGVHSTLRDAIIKMAQTYAYNVIDATVESGINRQHETWGSAGRYLVDGLHPNEIGKKMLGACYANAIRNNLK